MPILETATRRALLVLASYAGRLKAPSWLRALSTAQSPLESTTASEWAASARLIGSHG
jgi:hypothetical protein